MKFTLKAALFAGAALCSTTASARDLVIGHVLPVTSHYGLAAQAFADRLEELSDGEFTVQQAPAGQLGADRDLIEGLQIGSVDFVVTASAPLTNFVPEIAIFDLPFLFRDYGHARRVLDSEIGDELLAKISENNIQALAWGENGFRHVTNSVREIAAPEDLSGLKIRTMENRVHMAAFSGIGAAPTPMAWTEVISALQQGVVDGQENPITVITTSNLWEVQKYFSATAHVYSPTLLLASPSLYSGLSDEEKGWFDEAAEAAVTTMRAEVDRLEEVGMEQLREHGMQVKTDIDRAPFAAAAESASYDIYTDTFGTELIDRIKSVD